jgi:hypothetical protein
MRLRTSCAWRQWEISVGVQAVKGRQASSASGLDNFYITASRSILYKITEDDDDIIIGKCLFYVSYIRALKL